MGFYVRYRERYVTVKEMNEHLRYVYNYYEIKMRGKSSEEEFQRKAYIEDLLVNFKLTYKRGSIPCTYICRKDGQEAVQKLNGGEAFRIMSKYYKVPRVDEKYCGRADDGGLSASPILYYNPKYENQWVEAYGYDMNSAYSWAMLQPIPDTSQKMRSGTIKEGTEIGFEEVLNPKRNNKVTMLVPKFSGFSLYIFPLMESPFVKFVENWYKKKVKSAPGSDEQAKAKGVLNFSIGQLQNVNPFIRATIIGRCNSLIESLIDENTLFCNTDSIVSLVPLDLKIGTDVGEWKLEHEGKVAYVGSNYQWRDGEVSYRHIPKAWFPKGWDITRDPLPQFANQYYFDSEKGRLIRRKKNA